MNIFSGIPFLRICIPFIAGILIAVHFSGFAIEWFYLFLPLIPLILINSYKSSSIVYKRLFMFSMDVFLLLFGIFLTHLKDQQNNKNYYGNQVVKDSLQTFIAVISDIPKQTKRSTKCELSVLQWQTQKGYLPVSGTCYAYVKQNSKEQNLKAGQTLLIKAVFKEIDGPKNPYEFNYKEYLHYKQISHTLFVESRNYKLVECDRGLNPIWSFGLKCKHYVLSGLENSGLSPQAYAICAALLTGYDDEIDQDILAAFSHSGTLHVLSVSGLHIGLIYLILNFLFDRFDRKRKYKIARFLIISLLLWFFALITGFSAPVLRSVIMFILLGAGKIFFRNQFKNQLNILFVSAFILLAYNPYYLFDLGFLLSYFALIGILYFQPKFEALWQTDNKILFYFWQSITVSFAATISTLPITLFFFKQFPLWFFVCNIIIVPASFLVLILSALILINIPFIPALINYLIKLMIDMIMPFNTENIAYIDRIHFTSSDVFFLSVLIFLLSIALEYRSYNYLKISFICLILWQCISLTESFLTKEKKLFSVYQIKNRSSFSIKNKNEVTLNFCDTLKSSFNYSIKPHLISFNYPEFKNEYFNFIQTDHHGVLIINEQLKRPDYNPQKITELIISNNALISEKELKRFPHLKCLVLDGSNNRHTALVAEKLSRKFGLNFYNCKDKGAYLLALE